MEKYILPNRSIRLLIGILILRRVPSPFTIDLYLYVNILPIKRFFHYLTKFKYESMKLKQYNEYL